jgi:hypothetical protein
MDLNHHYSEHQIALIRAKSAPDGVQSAAHLSAAPRSVIKSVDPACPGRYGILELEREAGSPELRVLRVSEAAAASEAPKRRTYFRRAAEVRLPPDQVGRQGRITHLAFQLLGKDQASRLSIPIMRGLAGGR